MEILSVYRGARISAFKARELTREIQGLPAAAALDLIAFSTKKAALMVGKTLKSAIANAENNNELRVDTLVVKEATVGEGPTMRRIKSRARGSASTIRKRTSHIRIVLSDEIVIPQRKPKTTAKKRQQSGGGAKPGGKAKSPAAPAAAVVETSTLAEPATQEDQGPGETAAAPVESADTDTTKF
jgi:large subunit ribosomal protein L22